MNHYFLNEEWRQNKPSMGKYPFKLLHKAVGLDVTKHERVHCTVSDSTLQLNYKNLLSPVVVTKVSTITWEDYKNKHTQNNNKKTLFLFTTIHLYIYTSPDFLHIFQPSQHVARGWTQEQMGIQVSFIKPDSRVQNKAPLLTKCCFLFYFKKF